MDTVVLSDEGWNGEPYKSLYMRAVDALRETLDPAWGPLATRWFAYDKLALVRTQAFVDIGGYVFSESMFPLLNQMLSLETCLGSICIYSLNLFSSSLHPLKQARLTPK